MNYYERHIGDYLKDTAHLSLLEHGVYGRLLDVYYTREGAIPDAQVARLIGARTKDELAAMRAVLSEFFVQEEHGDWVQMRCEREISRYQDKQRKAKASAEARWAQTERTANGMRTHSERTADAMPTECSQTPDTRHHKEYKPPARKRAAPPDRPDDVGEQVWADWLALRKDKRARVSATVLQGARDEAAKAGMTLEAFLRVWCVRGSQGLEASWLKPNERQQTKAPAEPQWRTEQRARNVAFLGPAASAEARAAVAARTTETIDMEADHVPATKLG